ncbi:MAG: DUF4347 domain-containing protein [Mojavia pulchra JT2-VF2]|jgi:hypothetical protein|uniref:DUF4347 domain-containing protein n=1 Tax=Mojavia pulchra JT2-VF2 TaxID=287848 RepID=A0A951Q6F8_9NOST|nr:DUF4347 domain-containing protein [Mojavia pulchra JT2-VF2]
MKVNYVTESSISPVSSWTNIANSIVFIDTKVPDFEQLAAGVIAGVEVVVLDSLDDGIAQISWELSQRQGVTSVHLVAHGQPGQIQLGRSTLSLSTLDFYSSALQEWTKSLAWGAEILLYGCEVGAGNAGATFVYRLGLLLDTAIAASSTKVGNLALGGNWELDVTTGKVVSPLAFKPEAMAVYAHVLPDLFYDSFANNTGWTLGPEWQIGSATASSGQNYGNPDPTFDNTPTSDNGVAGVVIGGNASTSLHGYQYILSPVINTNISGSVFFDYYRWLNSDYTPYMQNTVEIYNGSSWVTLWSSGGSPGIQDNSWTLQNFDITAYKSAATQIRFGFNVGSTGVYSVSSWNIDDVRIYTDSVIPVNNAPTDLSLSATSVNENIPANTVIGIFNTVDPDAGNTHTYTLVSGTGSTDNANFSIVNGNQLSINLSPDYETKKSYSIRVRTTDQGGLSYEEVLTINVNNLNEAPVVSASSGNTFKITSLLATGVNAIEHNTVTGDDRGGIAISNSQVFYTGDYQTGRFALTDLSGGTSIGQQYDAIFSNLATGDVYTFANNLIPLGPNGGTITSLRGIDGSTGTLSGTNISLSTPINTSGPTGIFSGYNRAVIYTNSRVYNIDLPFGTVTDLGVMNQPLWRGSENWAIWGVAEYFDNTVHLVYVDESPTNTIKRIRVPDGVTETVATFNSLADMAAFTVSPSNNRWYFHHEGTSQFRSGDETIGYADASFLVGGGSGVVLSDDFDPGVDNTKWLSISSGAANTNFPGNGNSLWFNGNGDRSATTQSLNISNGGTISFDLIIGSDSFPRENADFGEDVVLEYSTNAGASWSILATYDQDLYTSWSTQTLTIPVAAQSNATQFRWRQISHSGDSFDNWAIDNISITGGGAGGGSGLADQTATANSLFNFSFASNVFTDPDGDPLAYMVTRSDGSPLPGWLSFNPSTRTFSGTPTNADVGTLNVRVTAFDPSGLSTNDVFEIAIASATPPNIVTNTNDSGAGSLRAAIEWANSNPGTDTITFNIAGSGAQTIKLFSALPTITDSIIIDGTTQANPYTGYFGGPPIELHGANAGSGVSGLVLAAGNSTIRGLVINRFSDFGIYIWGGGNNVIEGNYIGTDISGFYEEGNGNSGIYIESANNRIGGSSLGSRNVISGNNNGGINISFTGASYNQVIGNYIGLRSDGYSTIGNSGWVGGVTIGYGASSNAIANNVISGNGLTGANGAIFIHGENTTNNQVISNFIGTNAFGTSDLGNFSPGINISAASNTYASMNVIAGNDGGGISIYGSTATGNYIGNNQIGTNYNNDPLGNSSDGIFINDATNNIISNNTIAYNTRGVVVAAFSGTATGNNITGNSIFANTALGIDLNYDGVTLNDVGDGDTGANNRQNFPILTSATSSSGTTTKSSTTAIAGILNSKPNSIFRIEFFANSSLHPTGYGEGQTYLGSVDVTTNDLGNASFTANLTTSVPLGHFITATATDANNNTSEFSQGVTVTKPYNAPIDLSLSATSVNENIPANTIVGTFNTTDPDAGNTHTYTLVSGTGSTDNASFSIVQGNQLSINLSPDYETKNSYSIRVRTTDQDGLSYEEALTISVNNLNDAPVLVNNATIPVNQGSIVTITSALLQTTDQDNTPTQLTYTLTNLPTAGTLQLNGNTLAVGGKFTQDDINNGHVTYLQNGSKTTSDSFGFTVFDAIPSTITRISTSASGTQGNSDSSFPRISANGRYVAFSSYASNLVDGDTNGKEDVFVKDLVSGSITRISTSAIGTQGNSGSSFASISADGRYVAFYSGASNLVSGDTNSTTDVFVKDLVSNNITRISTDVNGTQGNTFSYYPSISADGRYVAFYSEASNLVSGDTNNTVDVFVKDLMSGSITRISTDVNGTQGNNFSADPSISADGRYVAFYSEASNLVSNDTNNTGDVFVKDLVSGSIIRISTDVNGTQGNNLSGAPKISADGRYVAFSSDASNLVSGDTNGTRDVFVKDLVNGSITRISTDASGTQSNGSSYSSSISADGRYVSFYSDASNLVSGDTNGTADVFVKDLVSGSITRITTNDSGIQGNDFSQVSSISADGRYVVFHSNANNLVSDDTNSTRDVFVRDLGRIGTTISGSSSITITPVNHAPVLVTAIADQSAIQGNAFSFTVPANTIGDPDNDPITYSAQLATGDSLPGWLTFDAATLTFNATPTNANVGTLSIRVIGADPSGASAADVFDLTVLPTLSASNITITEGDSSTPNAVLTVTLSAPVTQTVTLNYATADDTAYKNYDYTATAGILTFAAGETQKTISVPVINDTYNEANETFKLLLTNATNAAIATSEVTATIQDDDLLPTISVYSISLAEGDSGTRNATFSVKLSSASGQPVTVNYATADNTATVANADYTPTSGTLTFAPGNTLLSVNVAITGDTTIEPDETFYLNLSNPSGATLATSQGTATILNDDTVSGPVGLTIIGTSGNDTLADGSGDDTLLGLEGNDTLNGSSGNDSLTGGAGADVLTGGLGADRFIYPTFSESLFAVRDRIRDFNPNQGDRIVLGSVPTNTFNASIVTAADLNAAVTAAYNDADTTVAGSQPLAANQAVFFSYGATAATRRTYVSVNDSNAAFNASSDLFIEVTGMVGTLPAGALTSSNYFTV